jgi:hypothetical protein
VNIDFDGLAPERATKRSLDEYQQTTMFPASDVKKKLNHISRDGSHFRLDHLLRKLVILESSQIKNVFNNAGAGRFLEPSDHARKSHDIRPLRSKLANIVQKL